MSQDREMALRLTDALRRMLGGETAAAIATDLREIADAMVAGAAPSAPSPLEAQKATAKELYHYWIRATGRNPAAFKDTSERRSKVLARLKDGFSAGDIKAAIDYASTSEFHQGKNDRKQRYDDLTTICMNETRLENYRNLSRGLNEAPGAYRESSQGELAQYGADGDSDLTNEAKAALKRGDMDAYSDAQHRLRQRRQHSIP